MPQRIQLSRRAGWRKPEGAVVVGRPGRWGNPFSAADVSRAYPSLNDEQVAGMLVADLRDLINAGGSFRRSVRQPDGTRRWVTYTYPTGAEIVAELAGRDLACWCPLDQPCHADLLLEVANG